MLALETPHGRAHVHLHPADAARGALVLGHGAGGGVAAPDLVAATEAGLAAGVSVALVEQPYRVAGRRSPAPAHQLDAAWASVVEQLAAGGDLLPAQPAEPAASGHLLPAQPAEPAASGLEGPPLIVGGRSAGARVACRTAAQSGAAGVLCLAFPLRPPRRAGSKPAPDRLEELDAVGVPTLVVQGARDRFGMPPAGSQRSVVEVPGDHSLRSDSGAVADAVGEWLRALLDAGARAA